MSIIENEFEQFMKTHGNVSLRGNLFEAWQDGFFTAQNSSTAFTSSVPSVPVSDETLDEFYQTWQYALGDRCPCGRKEVWQEGYKTALAQQVSQSYDIGYRAGLEYRKVIPETVAAELEQKISDMEQRHDCDLASYQRLYQTTTTLIKERESFQGQLLDQVARSEKTAQERDSSRTCNEILRKNQATLEQECAHLHARVKHLESIVKTLEERVEKPLFISNPSKLVVIDEKQEFEKWNKLENPSVSCFSIWHAGFQCVLNKVNESAATTLQKELQYHLFDSSDLTYLGPNGCWVGDKSEAQRFYLTGAEKRLKEYEEFRGFVIVVAD